MSIFKKGIDTVIKKQLKHNFYQSLHQLIMIGFVENCKRNSI